MTNIGSMAVDNIINAQRIVDRAESGEVSWQELIDLVKFRPRFVDTEEVYEAIANLYFNLRLTEAAAYHFRGEPDSEGFRAAYSLVKQAREMRSEIVQLMEDNASYPPASALEKLGVMFVADKCQWALRLIDETFVAWGYFRGRI